MTLRLTAAILALAAPALAHRLDEYLQNTLVSISKDQVRVQMTLTPGVAVLPIVIPAIDTDGNGAISVPEQRLYAAAVLRDLSLTIDEHRLTPGLLTVHFPTLPEMQEGRGEIRLDFSADLPPGPRNRKLTFLNHHQARIAAFQVNCLVPRDPAIQVQSQTRNYSQSIYELKFTQPVSVTAASWSAGPGVWLAAIALSLSLRMAILWLRHRYPVLLPKVISLTKPAFRLR